jgi:hypothetical protein
LKTAIASLCLISILLLTTGCAAPRATPEEVRASELAARASRSAAAAASIPESVITQTKAACEQDLRSLASKSSGKYVHTVDSVQFIGDVSEYDMRNRPHAYDIVVSYTVRMTVTGELVKSKQTCRVTDAGNVEWMAA